MENIIESETVSQTTSGMYSKAGFVAVALSINGLHANVIALISIILLIFSQLFIADETEAPATHIHLKVTTFYRFSSYNLAVFVHFEAIT